MSYELIISEKPQAAEKIAKALADKGSFQKIRDGKISYFSLTHKGKQIVVGTAVGHLYILGEKGGESWKYPVFETEWKPIWKVNKAASYTADYIQTLTKLGREASEITVAADFDIEGEVIGLNVVRFALGRKDANRMKFSTLTTDELIRSYENKFPTLEWGQAHAGETRHQLDWFYGINLSRAFTESIKKGVNQFKVLSSGRVQAPSLHFLCEREKKIEAFIPEDFSEIYLDATSDDIDFEARYIDEKVFDKSKATEIVEKTKGKSGKITEIKAKKFTQAVPTPFDLTSLQMEANTMFGISPKRTLEIAQNLYVNGWTSYPRTSSQKLPKELELGKVLDKLSAQPIYREKVALVKKVNPNLKPNEGKKEDPAHPAIHPTGEVPKKLEGQDQKIYDLIVKRFLAVFGKPAIRETNTVTIDVNNYDFILKGTRTIDPQWHLLYEPYLKFEEQTLPKLTENAEVFNREIREVEKQTQPPKRYTQASIIKELEKRNLGTKATRATILESLYSRGYVVDKSIKVTELGRKMDEVIAQELPIIVDEQLTREFEEEMEKIREKQSTPEKVLMRAKTELEKVLLEVKKKEAELGVKLAGANYEAQVKINTVGKCPNCENGILMIRSAKKTGQRFVGCNNYPECKTIFSLPNMPVIKGGEDLICPECNNSQVIVGKSEGNTSKLCINPDCITRKQKDENGNIVEEKSFEEEGMICPNCKEGHMKLRKSFYGQFLGCDNYPKCKTMMKINAGKVDTTPISPKPKAPAKKKVATKKETTTKKKE